MKEKLKFGRYDCAVYTAFIAYALCSMAIPLTIVEIGKSLAFPLDDGGMAAGGILHLVRSLAMVFSLLLCGIIAAKLGKRWSMGVCMLLSGCGILLCSVSPCYAFLLPFLLMAGLGEGLCEGIATPFVQDLHEDAPERYVNIAHSMWSVGIALAVLAAGLFLSSGMNWRVVLAGCGLLALFSAVLFIWKENPEHRYPEHYPDSGVRNVLPDSLKIWKNMRFWVYCFGMFMGAGSEFCLTFWSAAYLRLNYGASVWAGTLGTGAIAAGMFLGRMTFGYIARRNNLKKILLYSGLCTIPLTLLLAFLSPEMFASRTVLFAVLFLILFLCGIGIAPYWPTLQVYGVQELPELDSTLVYIYFSAIGTPGCGFFTWFMGVLGDRFGLHGAFLLIPASLVLFVLTIFLEGWVFPRKHEISASGINPEKSSDHPAGDTAGSR